MVHKDPSRCVSIPQVYPCCSSGSESLFRCKGEGAEEEELAETLRKLKKVLRNRKQHGALKAVRSISRMRLILGHKIVTRDVAVKEELEKETDCALVEVHKLIRNPAVIP